MAALTSALDKMEITQTGENGAIEYGWTKDVHELIVQFQFQLVRNKNNLDELKKKFEEILYNVFITNTNTNTKKLVELELAKIVYKLIAYTRDIVCGKGEYTLSYMLISELVKFGEKYSNHVKKSKFMIMAENMLEKFVKFENNEHPYGSWKDLKYFCNYYTDYSCDKYMNPAVLKANPIIDKVTTLFCEQLKNDLKSENISLVSRWIPREKSNKFGWLTPLIAEKYYSEFFNHKEMTDRQYKAAQRKALTYFRHLISDKNKELKTPQINQCEGTWSNINFDKDVTSITMRKQSKAFKMVDKKGNQRKVNFEKYNDRLECSKNLTNYLNDCSKGIKTVKGSRISLIDFVRDALNIIKYPESHSKEEIDLLNMQWEENGKSNNGKLTNMIAMVDTSASMTSENNLPLYSAIGLGIRIAEKSKLGKRVLTFNSKPEWIDLENLSFIEMVKKISMAQWGMNTNFEAAFDKILNAAILNDITPYEMQNFVLLICSDMQIDQSSKNNSDTMYEIMKNKYINTGLNSKYQTPYTLPHIVFWNMRSTNGFPSLSTNVNTSMLSGNSPALLNQFNEKGISALDEMTPWKLLVKQLDNKRYKILEDKIEELWL